MGVKQRKQVTLPNDNMENVIDLDLSAIKKKRIRINGDNNAILELNTSDAGILARLEDAEKRMNSVLDKMMSLQDKTEAIENEEDVTEEARQDLSKTITELDNEMRDTIDYVFDANVSEVCVPSGTMFDPIEGMFRYEHIIDKLIELYEQNIKAESRKMQARISKHTKKYKK